MARPPIMTQSEYPTNEHAANPQNVPPSHAMPPHKEASPGVYVRSNQYQPQELDMLWSGSKHFQKEDRSPIVFTAAGLLLGIVITSALFFLFTSKPDIQTGDAGMDVPVISDVDLLDAPTEAITEMPAEQSVAEQNTADTPEKSEGSLLSKILPVGNKPKATEAQASSAKASPSSSSADTSASSPVIHVVQPGDTLGTIAEKYYSNTGDNYVAKIVRANNLANPDSLYIDQRLVIPQ